MKKFISILRNTTALLFLSAFTSRVWAALPPMEPPSTGAGGGIMSQLKGYSYDGGIFLGLLIATVSFLGVAWYGMAVFSDVQKGKKTWTDFGAVVGIGVLLVVVVIWLLTKAADILA